MFNLFILILERVGLIIILAYLLMNTQYFRDKLGERQRLGTKVALIIVFGIFAVISNYTGVEISRDQIISDQVLMKLSEGASLANTRVLTIGVAGLIGGPLVGTSVGVISGVIRFFQGGEEAYIYVISSILIGLISGLYGAKTMHKNAYPTIKEGFMLGAVTEGVQMLSILVLSRNLQAAWDLVTFIAFPMILVNSMGTGIFLSIISSTLRQVEQTKAVQTHDVLQLANQTMPYFRSGMNEASCTEAAKIIQQLMKVSAVSITNTERILAYVGAASDHHIASNEILTELSKEVLRTGEIREVHSHDEIGCNHPGCPLQAALVIPLKAQGKTIGTLKLYFTDATKLTFVERQLAEGLGNIFSSQIELGEIELQSKLLQDAEIKSLQAQVNPHFFFNAINTVSALIRVDSEKARRLLIQLSNFFRANLQGARTNLIPLLKELTQVEAYRSLEQARFPDRYQVDISVEEGMEEVLVPPFLIQILLENAFKHAFGSRKTDNRVWIDVKGSPDGVFISVRDNGEGIDSKRLEMLGKETVPSLEGTGSALENLNKRLISLFGEAAKLHFVSAPTGTTVYCMVPYQERQG